MCTQLSHKPGDTTPASHLLTGCPKVGCYRKVENPLMLDAKVEPLQDTNPQETSEWLEALDELVAEQGPERAAFLLRRVVEHAANSGVTAPLRVNTPYVNTIPAEEELPYPGDRQIERRIKSLIRWNAMAMV